ncbi:MAG: TonB-dependent receptor, partial [Candidatus Tectomicrobia bacterium]|nr:TonB-dependent receptor [Candidatus Tectomicrobia bacterium]
VFRDVATLRTEKKSFPWAATDIALQLAYTYDRERFTDTRGNIGTGFQDLHNTTNTYSANGLLTWYLDAWHQTASFLMEERYETFRSIDMFPERRGLPSREGPLQRRNNVILGLQDELRLFRDALSLRPLLRYHLVHNDFGADPTSGNVKLNVPRRNQEDFLNPSLGVKYTLLSGVALKGNVGRFTRVPTLFELFGDRGTTVGNPALQPERSTNWDVGFTVEWPGEGPVNRLFFEYAYFGSDAEDIILFVQNSQNSARAENIGSARIRGHELSWSVTALQHLRLFGNYTFQDAVDTSATFSRGKALPGRPRHELHQGLELFAPFGKVTYELDYIARNFLDNVEFFVVDNRLLHNVTLTAFPFGKHLKLTLELKNLTDNRIADTRGFPLPGRSVFGTVEGKF